MRPLSPTRVPGDHDSKSTRSRPPFPLGIEGLEMSSQWSHSGVNQAASYGREFDDAEKGMYDHTEVLPSFGNTDEKTQVNIDDFLSPISPVYEGITPSSSVPVLTLTWPGGREVTKAKTVPELSPTKRRWILFQLWFNTYRKFFTLVTLLNLVGIIMAAANRFPYAENHLGALVLGNLLMAILMRNELFLRILYIISIYGLRSVCSSIAFNMMGINQHFFSGHQYRLSWQ